MIHNKLKDSWERIDYPTGARRDTNKWKPRYDLISPFFLRRLAIQMMKGCEKYWERNWELWIPTERFMESMERHYMQYKLWETDEDHLSAAAFNLMWIIHNQEKEILNTNKDNENNPWI